MNLQMSRKIQNKEEIRCIMKFYFLKNKNASYATKKICAVYGSNALSERTVREWFARFRQGNFELNDAPRSGRPIADKDKEILEMVNQNRHISSDHIAKDLGLCHQTVLNHLKKLGYKKKLDVWVPHNLSEKDLISRISICESLLRRNEIEPFLKNMITADEKWITYDNNVRKRSWSKKDEAPQTIAKPTLTLRKVMLSVFWDWKGIVHYELLEPGQTVDSLFYCDQLERLNQAMKKIRPDLVNRKSVVFHHDNARPHTSLMTRKKLKDLNWEVLMHPAYSPDLAPSDYHLFRDMQNFFNGLSMTSREDCKKYLVQFFDQKSQKFYSDGIMALPDKWQKVVQQNGTYLI